LGHSVYLSRHRLHVKFAHAVLRPAVYSRQLASRLSTYLKPAFGFIGVECIRSLHRSDNAVDVRRTKVIKQVLQTRNRRDVGSQELHVFVDVKRGHPTSRRSDEQPLRCDTPDLIPILAPK